MRTITDSVKANLGSYVSGTNVTASGQNNPVGHDSTNTGNRAQFTLTRNTSPVVIYNIPVDTKDIPAAATIISVTVKVRCCVSNTTRVTAATVNLYSGTTAKGTAQDFRTTTTSNVETITGSNITVSDLSNLRIQFNMTRNSTNTNTYMYLYGADITVNYSVTIYEGTLNIYNASYETEPENLQNFYSGDKFSITFSSHAPNVFKWAKDNNISIGPEYDAKHDTRTYTKTVNEDFTLDIMCSIYPSIFIDNVEHPATSIYKKVNGNWVEQPEQDWWDALDSMYN